MAAGESRVAPPSDQRPYFHPSDQRTYLNLVACDADSLGDQLFLHAIRVADAAEDGVEQFELVARVAEPLSLWWWAHWRRVWGERRRSERQTGQDGGGRSKTGADGARRGRVGQDGGE